jgi:hypothetical protein
MLTHRLPIEVQRAIDPLTYFIRDVELVGSRVTCDPPPTHSESDTDVLVWVTNKIAVASLGPNYVLAGSLSSDSNFMSVKIKPIDYPREINLIITDDGDFYHRFLAATEVAKRFNLLKKEDRIFLFQAVLYGQSPRKTDGNEEF